MVTMKSCSRCKEVKSLDDFNKNRCNKDGLQFLCRPCQSLVNKDWDKRNKDKVAIKGGKWYQQNKDRKKAKNKKYYAENKGLYVESTRRWQIANPEKRAAHNAVHFALKANDIEKWPCQVCGDERSEAHHVSYDESMWLSVSWLCRQHHRDVHTAMKDAEEGKEWSNG